MNNKEKVVRLLAILQEAKVLISELEDFAEEIPKDPLQVMTIHDLDLGDSPLATRCGNGLADYFPNGRDTSIAELLADSPARLRCRRGFGKASIALLQGTIKRQFNIDWK